MAGGSTDKVIRERRTRVLLCVLEIDGHDRGLKYIAKTLAEAGMEVVYITFRTIEEIVSAAIQEEVDVIGISSSIGGHMTTIRDLMESLRLKGVDDKLVMLGGIIPTADIGGLREMGIGKVFGPGANGHEVIDYILKSVKKSG